MSERSYEGAWSEFIKTGGWSDPAGFINWAVPWAINWLVGRGIGRHDAEDAVQDRCLVLFQRIRAGSGVAADWSATDARWWLATWARKPAWRAGRRRAAQSLQDCGLSLPAACAPPAVDPLDRAAVAGAAEALPGRTRSVLLVLLSGKSQVEAASVLGLSPATVSREARSAVTAIRNKLRLAVVLALLAAAWRSLTGVANARPVRAVLVLLFVLLLPTHLWPGGAGKLIVASHPRTAAEDPPPYEGGKWVEKCEVKGDGLTLSLLDRRTQTTEEVELFGVQLLPSGTALNPTRWSDQSRAREMVLRLTKGGIVKSDCLTPSRPGGRPKVAVYLPDGSLLNRHLVRSGVCLAAREELRDDLARRLQDVLREAEDAAAQGGRGLFNGDE